MLQPCRTSAAAKTYLSPGSCLMLNCTSVKGLFICFLSSKWLIYVFGSVQNEQSPEVQLKGHFFLQTRSSKLPVVRVQVTDILICSGTFQPRFKFFLACSCHGLVNKNNLCLLSLFASNYDHCFGNSCYMKNVIPLGYNLWPRLRILHLRNFSSSEITSVFLNHHHQPHSINHFSM
jgi:hypothetical protein